MELLSNAQPFDQTMLDDWARTGGLEFHLGVAQGAAQAVLDAMPVEDKAGFESGFDGLPQAAQTAIITELALSPGGAVRLPNAEELQNFAADEAGGELVQEWRSRAGRKVGIIHDRVQRILGGMSEGEEKTALAWFDNLTAAQAKSVLRGLAG